MAKTSMTLTVKEGQPPPPLCAAAVSGESGGGDPMRSVNELRNLSTVLHAFRRRWDELQKHLDFIQDAIASRSRELDASPQHHQALASNTLETSSPESADLHSEPMPAQTSVSELGFLCGMMRSRGLRKYIISHLSDVAKLREEVPAALKGAPKPAKLVLECIGRFFLQGSKAFGKATHMVPSRQASLLILEFFLLSDCTEMEPSVKEEADLAAVTWRKRLINEGGVSNASDIDARGLLLLVASFGIPALFRNEDLRNLIRLSCPKEISDVLRRSRFLLARVPDVIQGMIKNQMNVEAVDFAYTFGLEEKFPIWKILTSFLREHKEEWKRTREEDSPIRLKKANENYLSAMKSVTRCLEDHRVDPSKLLSGWHIDEKIIQLEKEMADLDKKMEGKVMLKRKADEIDSLKKMKTREIKHSPIAAPSSVIGLQEQRVADNMASRSFYDSTMPINFLDSGFPGHISTYPAASVMLHGSGGGSLPENITGTMSGSGSGTRVHGTGTGPGMAGTGGVPSMASFSGAHGEMLFDRTGQMMKNNGPPYAGRRDMGFNDRVIGQSFIAHPASMGVDSIFGPSTSMESFPGMPNAPSINAANGSSASDLYQFADAVFGR